MKIDAAKAYCVLMNDGRPGGLCGDRRSAKHQDAIRIVRESDWRRIMAVVKAVDADLSSPHQLTSLSDKTWVAWKDLQSHVAKRKSK